METFQILVVDDEPMMRAGEMRILRDFKVEVADFQETVRFALVEVDTGEAALAYFDQPDHKCPDIMLLDLGLPGLQGLDVLQRIIADGREVLPIVVTAYASIETAVSTTKQGAFDFLAKPFTPEELRNTVERATRHLFAKRQAKRLQQEKHQMRFQLITIVAHELKSPIAAIEGYLRILQDPGIDKDAVTAQRMVDRSLIRLGGMRKLIVDLLDLTRIESGQNKRNLVLVDFCEVARCAIENSQADAKARNIAIEASLPGKAMLIADPGEIEIILNNLISNAVKYNRDEGKVSLVVADRGAEIALSVRDTGIGMAREETARLFHDFVRIKNSKTALIPGSGLGLSIVKKLVTLYGGTVEVESEPDVGTTFTATFQVNLTAPVEPKRCVVTG